LLNTDVLAALSADLSEICRVKVIAPCTAITLVGRGMRSLLHKLSDVWAMFGRERVHLISQSSNDLNLTFVIDEADADGLLPVLHAALIDSDAMPVEEISVFGPRWREINGAVRHRGTPWWHGASERSQLLALAKSGTPRYVYHLPTVRARARALAGIGAIDRRFYAIKANSHPVLLRTVVEEGFGLECVSQGELERVFEAVPGLAPQDVLFTPSFAPRAEYEFALSRGVIVTLDNVEALRNWPTLFRGRSLWLRIDLGRGDGHHDKVKTGGKASKFGLPLARLEEFLTQARSLDIRVVGLHAHLGSGVETPQHWRQVCDELGGIADQIGSIQSIDIGGGLPIPYSADDEPFDLETWSAGLAEIKAAYPGYQLIIEPGRYLVAESGVLLTHVTQVVDKEGIRRVGADAGMNALIRPALYDAWHDVANLTRLDDGAEMAFDVVGPICESSDVFGKRRRLPAATAEGDVLVFADAGAYGYSMANTYNLRALPAEDVIDGAEA
jgi:diaminopimelate decarboxylase/aspartate kinase